MVGPVIGFFADIVTVVADTLRLPGRAMIYHYSNEDGELVYRVLPKDKTEKCSDFGEHFLGGESPFPPGKEITCTRCNKKFRVIPDFETSTP